MASEWPDSNGNHQVYTLLKGCAVHFKMFDPDEPDDCLHFKHVVDDRGWHGVQNRAAVELARRWGDVYGDVPLGEAYGIEPRIMLEAHFADTDSGQMDAYAERMFSSLHQLPPSDKKDPDDIQKLDRAMRVRKRIIAAFEDEPAEEQQWCDGPSDNETSRGEKGP